MNDRERQAVWTEEHLMELPDIGYKAEVVEGRLTMAPAGAGHGSYNLKLAAAILAFVEAHALGAVLDSSTGFTLDEDNLLSPDIAFVSIERVRKLGGLPDTFFPGAPDLAVEVLSPNERPSQVLKKVRTYLNYGSRTVWIVDPATKSVTIHRRGVRPRKTTSTLDGGEVLPGFKLALRDLFRRPKL